MVMLEQENWLREASVRRPATFFIYCYQAVMRHRIPWPYATPAQQKTRKRRLSQS